MQEFLQPLSPEEERHYLILSRQGDMNARNLLVEHNLRLVAHIVKKYHNLDREKEDMISIGVIGLIKAINTYDISKGHRLVTYAARCIENEILMYIRSSKKYSNDMFLQDPVGHDFDGNEITVMDIVKTDDDPVPDEVGTKLEINRMFEGIDDVLDEREKQIIEMRYALGGGEEITQREIAKMFGISRSYVSRIEKKALKKISAKMGE